MNKVILMGRLTKDPELSQTPQGTQLCRFTIAVDRRFKKEGQQTADFINCTAWRQQAEFICKYFKKGNMISVIGNIQSRSWEKDGVKQFATDVVIDEVYFTGSKADSGTFGGASQAQAAPQKGTEDINAPFDEFDSMGFAAMGGSEDDLPF